MGEQLRDELSAVDLVEVRVGLSGLTAEVQRMRADMAPLAALPTQLQAVAELQAEKMRNETEARQQAVTAERQARERADAELRTDVDQLQKWFTWLVQLVVGGVILAVLDLITGPSTGVL